MKLGYLQPGDDCGDSGDDCLSWWFFVGPTVHGDLVSFDFLGQRVPWWFYLTFPRFSLSLPLSGRSPSRWWYLCNEIETMVKTLRGQLMITAAIQAHGELSRGSFLIVQWHSFLSTSMLSSVVRHFTRKASSSDKLPHVEASF